jgi:archaeal flagellar protein FlaF
MAVAEIIGAAIGVLLLVVVAYLLVGGTLSAAETVATAQKDLTLLDEARLRTSITITDKEVNGNVLNISVTNTGNEIITDLPHMDVFSYDTANGYTHYSYDRTNSGIPETWSVTRFEHDYIHAKELDPGVKVWIKANLPEGVTPISVQVTTGNGVSAVSRI